MFSYHDIRDLVRRRPFSPLRIVTSSGEAFNVHHPDMVMVGKRFLIIGLPSSEDPHVFEKDTRVAIMHVTELRDLGEPEATGPK